MRNGFKHIRVTEIGSARVVCFKKIDEPLWGGDVKNALEIGQEFDRLLEDDDSHLILDFEDKDFLPLAEFKGRLVILHKRAQGRLKLCGLAPRAMEGFQRNHLADIFDICPTREEALQGLT